MTGQTLALKPAKVSPASPQIRPSRSTKVLINVCGSRPTARIVRLSTDCELGKKSSAPPPSHQGSVTFGNDSAVAPLDKRIVNTFVERLEIHPAWGAKGDSNWAFHGIRVTLSGSRGACARFPLLGIQFHPGERSRAGRPVKRAVEVDQEQSGRKGRWPEPTRGNPRRPSAVVKNEARAEVGSIRW